LPPVADPPVAALPVPPSSSSDGSPVVCEEHAPKANVRERVAIAMAAGVGERSRTLRIPE
jgi:hypothetical protein